MTGWDHAVAVLLEGVPSGRFQESDQVSCGAVQNLAAQGSSKTEDGHGGSG